MTATVVEVSSSPVRIAPDYDQKRKDGHIKRPMNAFMVWSQIQRAKIVKEKPSMHNAAISKQLGTAWKQLSPDERLPYIIESQRLKRVHKQQYPDYKYRPKKRSKLTKEDGSVSPCDLVKKPALHNKPPSPPPALVARKPISTTASTTTSKPVTQPRSASPPAHFTAKPLAASAKPLSVSTNNTTKLNGLPRKRTSRHVVNTNLTTATTNPTKATSSIPQIKRKRSLKLESASEANDRFEFVESTLPRKVVHSGMIKRFVTVLDAKSNKRIKITTTTPSSRSSHPKPRSDPAPRRPSPPPLCPPTISRSPKFTANSPVLPHESEIISELGPPEETTVPKPAVKQSGTCLIDTLYFDNYVDYFTGAPNETDDYTTDEVWNLIKLESPFYSTCNYYGSSLNSQGNTTSCC